MRFAVSASAVSSLGFSSEVQLVYFSERICELYTAILAGFLGNFLAPLVTAMSVEVKSPGEKLPADTLRILIVLVFLLLTSWGLYSLVASREAAIKNYGEEVSRPSTRPPSLMPNRR